MSEQSNDRPNSGLFQDVLQALADKHSQLDINLQNVSIGVPGARMSVEISGLVTITAHVRDLTEDERRASSTRNVARMSH